MTKRIILILFFAKVASVMACPLDTNKSSNFNYPQEIIKLNKEKLFDDARWFMYCTQASVKLKFSKSSGITNNNVLLGSLPLVFDHIQLRGDTTEIDFYFYYKGKRVDELLVESSPLWGVVYIGKSDRIALLSSRSDVRYFGYKCPDKNDCKGFESYLKTPYNLGFIRKNKNKLDPWFRKEAIKRGVISE